jgi:hypothetical protein
MEIEVKRWTLGTYICKKFNYFYPVIEYPD